MLKFQLLQVQDIREAAKIEKRRRDEEERKQRIFNARQRLIGLDMQSLNKQVEERKQAEEQQKRLDEQFAEEIKRNAIRSLAYERKEKQERKKINEDIDQFRKAYQKFEDRREFDLNDPNALQNSLPPRLRDDDPRCGISSAQKFEGEDLASMERKKLQIEQTKAFLEQQLKEHHAADEELQAAEDAYQAAIVARDHRALELDRLEKECRKKLDEAQSKFNLSLMQQQKLEEEMKKRQELEDNFAEMYNAVTSDMLTENPNQCKSNFGPQRPIAFQYKGMTQEEKDLVRKQQLLQIEENKIKRQEAEVTEKYWNDYIKGNTVMLGKLEKDMRLKRQELNKQTAEYNKTLAEEQRAYKEYLDRVVYTNKPTAAFYEQFNAGTR